MKKAKLIWFWVLTPCLTEALYQDFEITDAEVLRSDRFDESAGQFRDNSIPLSNVPRHYDGPFDFQWYKMDEENERENIFHASTRSMVHPTKLILHPKVSWRFTSGEPKMLTSGVHVALGKENSVECQNVTNFQRVWFDCAARINYFCSSAGMDALWSTMTDDDMNEIIDYSKTKEYPFMIAAMFVPTEDDKVQKLSDYWNSSDTTFDDNKVDVKAVICPWHCPNNVKGKDEVLLDSFPNKNSKIFKPYRMLVIKNGELVDQDESFGVSPICIKKVGPIFHPASVHTNITEDVLTLQINEAGSEAIHFPKKAFQFIQRHDHTSFTRDAYLAPKTNTLVTTNRTMVSARSRVLPRLKRTSIGFQHVRDEIANTLSNATVRILEQDYSRLEDPAILLETSESIGIWSKEHITIPPMDKPNQRLILEATFDTNNGKIGFDDVHIRTRERCSPRWHKHDRQQFNFLTIPNLWPTLDEVESSGIDENILAERFGFRQFSNISLELCSRHCFLGSGCDVFQYVPADDLNVTQCVLAPHLRLKSHHWFQYTEKAPIEAPRTALYVLECSVAMENLLLPNHPSDNPDILQSSCQSQGVLIHEQNHLNPIYVHGANIIDPWFAFCSQINGYLSLEFPISEAQLPLGMNLAYLTTFKPIGLLRLWYRASQFEATTFDFVGPRSTETISLELIVGTADPNSIEAQESDSVLGTFDLFPDMSQLMNEVVKVNVSMSASDTGLVTFVDLLIDMPIRLGCFEPVGNGSNQGVGFIPTSCLVTCFGNGKQRYAGMTAGSECICLDEPPSSNQVPMEKCETRCEEDNLQFCGGSGGEILVFVAACPEDQVRFEDVCMELLDNPQGVNDNSYKCSSLGMSLWYPSSYEEFQFVSKNYQGIDEGYVHVGIRAMDREFGILQSDYSVSMGIPFLTHDASGELRFSAASDQQQPLMTLTRCIVLNLTTGDMDLLEPCPNAIALCKQKLVGNRAKILDLDVVKSYSPMKDTSTMFHQDSVNSVHFGQELLPIMPESFLEVALPRKSSIIGLVLQTHKEQFFKEFGLQYQRLSFNSPNSWTTVEWGIKPMIHANLRQPNERDRQEKYAPWT